MKQQYSKNLAHYLRHIDIGLNHMDSKNNNNNVAGHCIVHTYIHSTTIIINIEEVLDTVCFMVAQLVTAITGYFICDNSAVLGGTVKRDVVYVRITSAECRTKSQHKNS
jgi:hypothetical protein